MQIKGILWRLAIIFRWKDKRYSKYFSEEISKNINKVLDDMDIDLSDVKLVKRDKLKEL